MGRFDILKQDSNRNHEISSYKSDFNFSEFGIEDKEIINKVTKNEQEITRTAKQIAKKTLELGRMLCETQKLMSNYKNGTFTAWFTYVGMKKNFVYREINRWELFQRHKNPQIAEASIRTLEFIKKQEEILEETEISEILEDPKMALEKIKEIKKNNILENDKNNNSETEIERIDEKIEKLKEQIKKLEEKKIKLQEIYSL